MTDNKNNYAKDRTFLSHTTNPRNGVNLIPLNYRNQSIGFEKRKNGIFVNATQMGKIYEKQPAHWFNLKSTQEYIKEYTVIKNRSSTDIVQVTRGGTNQGTWVHEDIALEFARWLNPAFSIWCNDTIKELLQTGKVNVPQPKPKQLSTLELLETAVEELKAKEKEIKQLKPKAEFCDRVIDTGDNIDIGQAAKILDLPFGRNTFFKKLREMGVFFKNRNEPKQEHITEKRFLLKETFIETNTRNFTTLKVLVTQKGLGYLSTKFNAQIPSKKLAKIGGQNA